MQQIQPMQHPPQPNPALPAQPPALVPGTWLGGRYLIQGYIGGGGFGHIYKAQDRVLGYRRAIKEAFFRDPQTQRQFRLEAEFIVNARHPHLVCGYAVFEQAGRFYLVMDYVDGHTLEEIAIQHIRRTNLPLPEAQVLDWIMPICDAVHTLHTQPTPIIHRDVKPANIKLTRQGIPMLIDLGLAKLYAHGTQTIGAALAFTPGYAPPEQYQASGATDQRTDIYGLGATLFYLLTGYQPTEAPARLSAQSLPSLSSLNTALSPLTEQIVLKAMSLDPAARQQDAHTLMLELAEARMALTGSATSMFRAYATLPPAHATLPPVLRLAPTNACLRCATNNPAEARFCLRCGMPMVGEAAQRDATSGAPVGQVASRTQVDEAIHHASTADAGVARNDGRSEDGLADTSHIGDAQALPHQQHAHLLAARPHASAQPHDGRLAPTAAEHDPREAPWHPQQAEVAVVAPLIDGVARVLPERYRKVPHSLARRLVPQPLTYEHEAVAVIAAILALMSASLSFAAVLTPWMLFFALPALVLAMWSLFRQSTNTPVDFTRLALLALLVSCLWPPFWYLATHHLAI